VDAPDLGAYFEELGEVPANLPFALYSPLLTITAHCLSLMDGVSPRDMAYCIKSQALELAAALLSDRAAMAEKIAGLERDLAALREPLRTAPVDEALNKLAVRFAVAGLFADATRHVEALKADLKNAALDIFAELARPYLNRAESSEAEVARLREELGKVIPIPDGMDDPQSTAVYIGFIDRAVYDEARAAFTRPDETKET